MPSSVSPESQRVIARPLSSPMGLFLNTTEEWRGLVAKKAEQDLPVLGQLRKLYPVYVTSQMTEGMSHAQYILAFTSPESKEAFREIARFFQNHLGRQR